MSGRCSASFYFCVFGKMLVSKKNVIFIDSNTTWLIGPFIDPVSCNKEVTL